MSQNTKKNVRREEKKPARTAPRESNIGREHLVEDENILERAYYAALRLYRHTCRSWRHIVQEKHDHNFPESDAFLVKFLLLLWGMLPALISRVGEGTRKLQRRAVRSAEKDLAWVERHPSHPVIFLGVGCLVAAVALFFSVYTRGTTVAYDGTVLANVASTATVEDACEDLERIATRTLGTAYEIDDSLFSYESGWMKRQEIVSETAFKQALSNELGVVTAAYSLYVEGERIGSTPYEGALEELLRQLEKGASDENTISITFAEKVEIKKEYVPTEDIMNLGHLAELLYSTKSAEVTYEVKKGDTWSEIAQDHGLTSNELLALNPGYNINKLAIGEILTLSASVPYLTMTVVQQERYVADVPYQIEYTDDASMYQGDVKVTSPGSFGAADTVANVTYVNGQEIQRTVLSSVTLKEPVTEQQLRGTKERPTWYPTGSFRWPTTGRITSSFGGRKSPGGIGSTNHKGLDIANSRGTAIYAADGGTVTYAGWMGGYGYTVKIRHKDGYETLYAHNSKLLVSAGSHVYKGQQIAKMGSTGNSTGSHCHFEIRLNGVAKNPMNYL